MSENKCCGSCKHFKDEDIEGFSYCEIEHGFKCCDEVCVEHEAINNGWTEITPDNMKEVSEIPQERLIIAYIINDEVYYRRYSEMFWDIEIMTEIGYYYYYVLPELKIE